MKHSPSFAIATVVGLFLAPQPGLAEESCTAQVLEDSLGITFARYQPDWSPANEDLEFTYSSGIFAQYADTTAIEEALDSLATLLVVAQDNIYSTAESDIALLYNMFRYNETAFPYPYGRRLLRQCGWSAFCAGGHAIREREPPGHRDGYRR